MVWGSMPTLWNLFFGISRSLALQDAGESGASVNHRAGNAGISKFLWNVKGFLNYSSIVNVKQFLVLQGFRELL